MNCVPNEYRKRDKRVRVGVINIIYVYYGKRTTLRTIKYVPRTSIEDDINNMVYFVDLAIGTPNFHSKYIPP